jgi:hypothetical protein
MDLNIVSKGHADTVISANGKKKTSKLSWDGNMKKGKGKLHIKMDNNGKKLDKTMSFTEQDLVNILSVPSVNRDIDQRLFNNYLSPSRMSTSMSSPVEIEMSSFTDYPIVELGEFPEDGMEPLSVLPFKHMDTKNTVTYKKPSTKKASTKKVKKSGKKATKKGGRKAKAKTRSKK